MNIHAIRGRRTPASLVLIGLGALTILALPKPGRAELLARLKAEFPKRALNGGPADKPFVAPFSIPGPGIVTMKWTVDKYFHAGATSNWPIGFRKQGTDGRGVFPYSRQTGGSTYADGVEVIDPKDGSLAVKTIIGEVNQKQEGLEVVIWPLVPPGSYELLTQLEQKVQVSIEWERFPAADGGKKPEKAEKEWSLPILLSELIVINWQYGREAGEVLGRIMFRTDGSFYGFESPDVVRWAAQGGAIVFFRADGTPTASFTAFQEEKGLWTIRGFQLPGKKVGVLLKQTEPLRIR